MIDIGSILEDDPYIKALSIRQPWAWAIVNGFKTVENRSWNTGYRGPLLVHASLNIDHEAYYFLGSMGIYAPPAGQIEVGGIVGVTNVVDSIHITRKDQMAECDKPWFFGEYGFLLKGSKPCIFKPCKGALGFYLPNFSSRYVSKQKKQGVLL